MQQVITALHLFISLCVIGLVLIQRGKGADMGAGFGSGASGTMFGSQGVTPFLVKVTAGLALLFFVSSSVLSFIVGKHAVQAELPFVSAPMKTVEPIPVSPEVQPIQQAAPAKTEAAPSVAVPVEEKPVVKKQPTTTKKEHTKKEKHPAQAAD